MMMLAYTAAKSLVVLLSLGSALVDARTAEDDWDVAIRTIEPTLMPFTTTLLQTQIVTQITEARHIRISEPTYHQIVEGQVDLAGAGRFDGELQLDGLVAYKAGAGMEEAMQQPSRRRCKNLTTTSMSTSLSGMFTMPPCAQLTGTISASGSLAFAGGYSASVVATTFATLTTTGITGATTSLSMSLSGVYSVSYDMKGSGAFLGSVEATGIAAFGQGASCTGAVTTPIATRTSGVISVPTCGGFMGTMTANGSINVSGDIELMAVRIANLPTSTPTSIPTSLVTCSYAEIEDFVILGTAMARCDAEAACQSLGYSLSPLDVVNFTALTADKYPCLGAAKMAWISEMGLRGHKGHCIAVETGVPKGSIVHPTSCRQELPAVCFKKASAPQQTCSSLVPKQAKESAAHLPEQAE